MISRIAIAATTVLAGSTWAANVEDLPPERVLYGNDNYTVDFVDGYHYGSDFYANAATPYAEGNAFTVDVKTRLLVTGGSFLPGLLQLSTVQSEARLGPQGDVAVGLTLKPGAITAVGSSKLFFAADTQVGVFSTGGTITSEGDVSLAANVTAGDVTLSGQLLGNGSLTSQTGSISATVRPGTEEQPAGEMTLAGMSFVQNSVYEYNLYHDGVAWVHDHLVLTAFNSSGLLPESIGLIDDVQAIDAVHALPVGATFEVLTADVALPTSALDLIPSVELDSTRTLMSSLSLDGRTLQLTVTAVPEPVLASLTLAAAGLLVRRQRSGR